MFKRWRDTYAAKLNCILNGIMSRDYSDAKLQSSLPHGFAVGIDNDEVCCQAFQFIKF